MPNASNNRYASLSFQLFTEFFHPETLPDHPPPRQAMRQEPDFKPIITAALQQRAAREAAEAEELKQQKESARKALLTAETFLMVQVKQILESACASLHDQGCIAEVGNGRDAHGCLRLSMRIAKGREALVFTAVGGMMPYLGYHRESLDMRTGDNPARYPDITAKIVAGFVSEFITHELSQP